MIRRKHRARPLAPQKRRESIVNAVIPLLIEHGSAVTTRQMAEAAGIAEGTIYRVFPDKVALIHEAIRQSMDPEPIQSALAEIYPEAPFEVQLAEAGRVLVERYEQVVSLMSTLRTLPHDAKTHRPSGLPDFVKRSNTAVVESLTELFGAHRDRLRMEPARAAAVFRGLVFASGHPFLTGREGLTINEIVEVLVGGILHPTRDLEETT